MNAAGLTRFYGQQVSWGGCSGFTDDPAVTKAMRSLSVQCARVQVPLDYDQPAGRTIELAVTRRRATQPAARIGALVWVAGGPGQPGVSAVANWASSPPPDIVQQRFDLVGLDPRGVGASRPQVRCRTDAEVEADRLRATDIRARGQACLARMGKDVLSHVGTGDVARDLDVLREVIGDAKLSAIGYSYGARVVGEYARQFPTRVRALVLDSAADTAKSYEDRFVGQAAAAQRGFNAFAAWCAAKPGCALGPGGGDPLKALAAYRTILRPLVTQAAPAGPGNKLSLSDAQAGVGNGLSASDYWKDLNQALDALHRGDGKPMLTLAGYFDGRDRKNALPSTDDVFTAVRCLDDAVTTDPDRVNAVGRAYYQAAPFLLIDGPPPSSFSPDECAYWPVPSRPLPPTAASPGLPHVLVVAITGDIDTPYAGGLQVAKHVKANIVTVQGYRHTVAFFRINSCTDQAVATYVVDPTRSRDTTCTLPSP